MKLAALAAGIDRWRKVAEKPGIEVAARKRTGQLRRVYACETRPQAACDHVPRERVRGDVPQRKDRREAGPFQLLLPVAADVFQEEIAEGHHGDAARHRLPYCFTDRLLVGVIAAWAGDGHKRQGQAGSLRLLFQ